MPPPSVLSPTIITSNGSHVPLFESADTQSETSLSSSMTDQHASFHGYHHVTWWVGNAKQAAAYYVARMGFRHAAYAGLETGSRAVASHVVANGNVIFVFSSPLRATRAADVPGVAAPVFSKEDLAAISEMNRHLEQHGDAVKDVAFEVDDARAVYARAVHKGAVGVQEPKAVKDENGLVVLASVRTYGDTVHTFIEKGQYRGGFLPGFKTVDKVDPLNSLLPSCELDVIDHCVGNQSWGGMEEACDL
jgi:4-hydroxyphenylpyruvate dioxygenase